MQKLIFSAFINRFIKDLPGDRRTDYHDQEEEERMHSACFFFLQATKLPYL